MKKQGLAFYLNAAAAVLGVAGVGCAVYSSVMTADNGLTNLSMVAVAGVVGVLLAALAMFTPARMGDHNPVTAVAVLGAIALYSYVYGQCVLQRIMLIAGLFSYNAGNTAGWGVFYATVACAVCMLVACVLLMVGGFCKSVKTAE